MIVRGDFKTLTESLNCFYFTRLMLNGNKKQ